MTDLHDKEEDMALVWLHKTPLHKATPNELADDLRNFVQWTILEESTTDLLNACVAALRSIPAEPQTLCGRIAAVYGGLDVDDCALVDLEWARMRGYDLPTGAAPAVVDQREQIRNIIALYAGCEFPCACLRNTQPGDCASAADDILALIEQPAKSKAITDEMLNVHLQATGEWVNPFDAEYEGGVQISSELTQEDADNINADQRDTLRVGYMAALALIEQPATRVGCVLVPRELTAENGARGALSGKFFVTYDYCDEEGDECTARIPISWMNIRKIHKKMIAHFSGVQAMSTAKPSVGLADRLDSIASHINVGPDKEVWMCSNDLPTIREAAAALRDGNKSAPLVMAPHNSGERLPNGDAAGGGADTRYKFRIALERIANGSFRTATAIRAIAKSALVEESKP
jgi:hypothetical protein